MILDGTCGRLLQVELGAYGARATQALEVPQPASKRTGQASASLYLVDNASERLKLIITTICLACSNSCTGVGTAFVALHTCHHLLQEIS